MMSSWVYSLLHFLWKSSPSKSSRLFHLFCFLFSLFTNPFFISLLCFSYRMELCFRLTTFLPACPSCALFPSSQLFPFLLQIIYFCPFSLFALKLFVLFLFSFVYLVFSFIFSLTLPDFISLDFFLPYNPLSFQSHFCMSVSFSFSTFY